MTPTLHPGDEVLAFIAGEWRLAKFSRREFFGRKFAVELSDGTRRLATKISVSGDSTEIIAKVDDVRQLL